MIVEAMLEAERHDPERVKRWVVLVDGAETQLDLVEAVAAESGVEVTVIPPDKPPGQASIESLLHRLESRLPNAQDWLCIAPSHLHVYRCFTDRLAVQ